MPRLPFAVRGPAALGVLFSLHLMGAGCTLNRSALPSSGSAKSSCADASLALDDGTVVGQFEGKPVTYADLGPELKRAEQKALHQYCDAVASARRIALDNHVTEALVTAKASAAGIEKDAWMKQELDKRVPEPSDADVQAFYDSQKAQMGERLPPLEMVREQVVAFLKRDKAESAAQEVIQGLLDAARVERSLPDVRSPPIPLQASSTTPVKGKPGAKVQLVEFADFQCPYCSRAGETVRELVKKYGDRVEFSYRHFPLRSIHPQAQRAAEITVCAGEQGKFWEAHDALYAHQSELEEATAKKHVVDAGVDGAKLDECLSAGRGASVVDQDMTMGEEAGVEGTPSFFINGRAFAGNPNVAGLSQALDEALGM
jgi:protein-disulfide isomerase